MRKIIGCLLCLGIIAGSLQVYATENRQTADGEYHSMIENFKNPPKHTRVNQIVHDWHDGWGNGTYQGKIDLLNNWGFRGVVTNVAWNENYLTSEEDFAFLNEAIQASKAGGMEVWLFDESGYPSGSADGKTLEGHPEYEAIGVGRQEVQGSGAGSARITADSDFQKVVAAYLVPVKDGVKDYANKEDVVFEGLTGTTGGVAGDWVVEIYGQKTAYEGSHAQNNGWKPRRYPNLLNRDAVKRFIDVAYQPYKDNLAQYDEVIEAVFTDEPSLMTAYVNTGEVFGYALVPWESTLPERFSQMHHYSILENMNALYDGDSTHDKQVRVHFYQTVSEMLKENYFGQLQKWCEENGVSSSGHALLEEKLSYHVPLYGDLMKVIGAEDIPAVDVLTGVPEAYIDNSWFLSTKFISSVARLQGKEQVMFEYCPVEDGEIFALNDFEYTLGTMGLLYLNGANYANSYYSIYDLDEQRANTFNEYVGRLGYMLENAQMDSGLAVYYPIESAQAEYKPMQVQVYNQTENISAIDNYIKRLGLGLLENKMDFNFVSSEYMKEPMFTENGMQIGNVRIDTLLMPKVSVIPLETLKTIQEFERHGGKVIWLENLPQMGLNADENKEIAALTEKYKGQTLSISGEKPEDNLARNAKVTVSSVQDHELYHPQNLTDGKNDTDAWQGWASVTTPAWVEIDLGETKTVNKAILYGKNEYEQKEYNLQYWNNGYWINLVPTVENNTEDVIEHHFPAVNTRKIRITMTRGNVAQDSSTGERVARWNEIELYYDKDGNHFNFYDLLTQLGSRSLTVQEIRPEQENQLMMSCYQKDGKELIYLVNPTGQPITASISGQGSGNYLSMNPRTGEIDPFTGQTTVTVKPYMGLFVYEK